MAEAPVDLRESLALVRRRWIPIVLVAVLGLAAGVAYGLTHKAQPSAVDSMLLPTASPAEASSASTQTAIYIATSGTLERAAVRAVRPQLTVGSVAQRVHASAVGDNIVRVQASAPHQAQALQLAGAVVDGYAEYAKKNGLGTVLPIGSPTALATPSLFRRAAIPASVGLFAGLGVSVLVLLSRARRDRRLRRRDELAAAISVPVIASLGAQRRNSAAEWVRSLQAFAPTPMNSWGLNELLRRIVPPNLHGPLSLQIVSFAGDRAALTTGPELALFAVEAGFTTHLVPGDHPTLEALAMACASLRGSGSGRGLLTLGSEEQSWHAAADNGQEPGPGGLGHADLIISVVAVERSQPSLTSFAGSTILSVSAGFPVVDDMARVALAATRGGTGIDGIVVVNPDPADGTAGLVPSRAARYGTPHLSREKQSFDFRSLR